MLPDYLAPGLRVVFCGTAAGDRSAALGHYYSGRGNDFWRLLHEAGFTPRELDPSEDANITRYGVGLTDLARQVSASSDHGLTGHYDVERLVETVRRFGPDWIAFHGKTVAGVVSRELGRGRHIRLGEQTWRVADAQVFVVPSASGANRDSSRLEGKRDRVEWFVELRHLAYAE